MGIGSVTSTNSMSSMQMITAASTDPKIKNVQNEITDTEQQLQKISSNEDLSVNEKADERKKLQKEISSLNTELKQYQEELSRSQKREAMLAELREEQAPSKEEESEDKIQTKETSSDKEDEKNLPTDEQQTKTPGTVISQSSDGTVTIKEEINQDQKSGVDTAQEQNDESKEEAIAKKEIKAEDDKKAADSRPTSREMHAMVSADSSIQQTKSQGTIIARTSDGIAILKEQIDQAEKRGENTEKKQAELEKMEKREEIATAFQFSILGEANDAMRSATETNSDSQINANNNAFINAMNISQQEEQAAQQRFYVSFT